MGLSLRILYSTDFESSAVITSWMPTSWSVSGEVASEIDAAWSAAIAVPNRSLFDGPMCRLESFDVSPAGVRIRMSRTSYKTFWGTNMSHPELADQFGPNALANSIGLSPALLTADGWLLMGRRNDRVAYYPGRVHPFSGCLEPGDGSPVADSTRPAPVDRDVTPPDVFAAVRRELTEELHLVPEDIELIRLIGLAEDVGLRQPELIFRVITSLSRSRVESQLDPAEHKEVVAIHAEPGAVAEAIGAAAGTDNGLTPIAVATLLLWGRIGFGEKWFRSCGMGTSPYA